MAMTPRRTCPVIYIQGSFPRALSTTRTSTAAHTHVSDYESSCKPFTQHRPMSTCDKACPPLSLPCHEANDPDFPFRARPTVALGETMYLNMHGILRLRRGIPWLTGTQGGAQTQETVKDGSCSRSHGALTTLCGPLDQCLARTVIFRQRAAFRVPTSPDEEP